MINSKQGPIKYPHAVLIKALLTASIMSVSWPGYAQPATPVGVDDVINEKMSQTFPVIGRIVPLQSGVVAARTPGPVARLYANVGDHIAAGAIIADLDQTRLQTLKELQEAEVQELEARKRTTAATVKLVEQEVNRLEKLRNTAAFMRYDYDKRVQELAVARSSFGEAEARIASGKIKLRQAEIELHDRSIRAPYSGTVIQRHTSEGAWLRIGDPVVTMISDREIELEAEVPAKRLQGIKLGATVQVRLDDGSVHSAKVRAIIPDENPAARTRPVRLVPEFIDLKVPVASNQTVTLLLPAGAENEVVTVHKDAVLRNGNQALVYVVADGVAKPRPVQLGEGIGNRFQVIGGLGAGEIVVIRGNERLRPGQQVRYPGQPEIAKADAPIQQPGMEKQEN